MQDGDNNLPDFDIETDIETLLQSSLNVKMDVVKKIGKYCRNDNLSEEQKNSVERIISVLIKEPEVELKQIMSESIKSSNHIPKEIIMELARDISIVAIPVLEFSELLTDKDLIYIVENSDDTNDGVSKQVSISKRKTVSYNVSNALIDRGNQIVVKSLLDNKGSLVSEEGYDKIIEHFPEKEVILASTSRRAELPVDVIQLLLEVEKGGKQNVDAEYRNFKKIVKSLDIKEDTIPIYALCLGNLRLFEVCVARIMQVPRINVRKMLEEDSDKNFQLLYKQAELSASLYDAVEVLYKALKSLGDDLSGVGIKLSERESKRLITNMMMISEELGGVDNIEYIIMLIRGGSKD